MFELIHAVAGRPWAIHGEIAAHVRGLIAKEGMAGLRHLAQLKAEIHAERSGQVSTPVRAVAVISVVGTLTQRPQVIRSQETRSTDEIAGLVAMAAADASIDAIVLDVDSPGGEVFGVQEAWDKIRAASRAKPVIAVANTVAASAAYYLATAAPEVFASPSSMVGSIGVYALHVDYSEALKAAGERWTFISAGRYKVEGNPTEPLTDEAHGALQADVDRYYDDFVSAVARGRGASAAKVRSGFGEGRMVGARAAVEQGMADRIGTLDDAVRYAASLGAARRKQRGAQARQRVV